MTTTRALPFHAVTILLLALVVGGGCKEAGGPPAPVQEALRGEARPALLLAQAWFWKDADGKQSPGPARLDIWREQGGRWERTRLEDGDSNVFHKAIRWRDGILTIGAERAMLKHWTWREGRWNAEVLWERAWGGRFQRLRDLEIGDVTGDGEENLVLATHDSGVVAVLWPGKDGSAPRVIEMDEQADTFVHEIEIGDIDGDGLLEFYATPSGRNQAAYSQSGGVVKYRWNGERFEKTWVEHQEGTHAKEILTHDIDGDGVSELFSVLEAEVGTDGKMRKPVEIRQYFLQQNGTFTHHAIGSVPDRQTRFLVPGDFDGDGRAELIAPALRAGLFHFRPPAPGAAPGTPWTRTLLAEGSSGFEHAAYATDLNGDGRPELYVAADDQGKLVRYDFDREGGFRATTIGTIDPGVLTFNINAGRF